MADETIDLSKKVKLENGKEVSLGDLLKAYSKADEAGATEAKLKKLRENISKAYTPGGVDDERKQAFKDAMLDSGFTEEQVDQALNPPKPKPVGKKPKKEEESEEEGITEEELDEIMAGLEENTPTVGGKAQKALEEQIKALRNDLVNKTRGDLQKSLNGKIAGFMGENKMVKTVRDRAGKGEKGKEKEAKERVEKWEKFVQNQLDRAVKEVVQLRVERGEEFSEGMFDQAIAQVGKGLVEVLQTGIDAHEPLGRAPETVSGFDTILKKEPAKAPEASAKVSEGELNRDLRDWLTDSLSRDAAELAAEESPSVV